ncbi:sugar phosphate isomerase/epimerase family protein [Rhizobium leguminosarum]|uniref:sugar phosphate isomerase/epimerase family protein n=1 Tax=Rhizobium leguminosarum TaxID=384 RepID=UPI001C96EF26|nr:sugar phosphate isomerase/epimerase [Rhizobium leguminosarum]MBY5406447.1 sugar phosphate isomerase/epimerase [Rhizobium leguminosarum]
MKLGIFAKIFPGDRSTTVFNAASEAGYGAVQYNMACSGIGALPGEIASEIVASVRDASLAAGVEIAAISATYNMIHPDLAIREAGRRSFEAIAASANQMGSNLLTVCSGSCDAHDQWRHHPDNESAAAWQEMVAELRLLVAIADRHNILIGVEPELANVISSPGRARKLIDELDSDRVRIVFDPANLFDVETEARRRAIIDDAVVLLADRIEIAHAKDRNADGSFATAGKGVIDYAAYIAALKRVGFSGSLITHGLAASEARGVADFLRATLGESEVV